MDRRTIWAILLMMAIAIVPAIFLKKPQGSGDTGKRGSTTAVPAESSATRDRVNHDSASPSPPPTRPEAGTRAADTPRATGATEDIVRVTSPLYTYGISTLGGRLVEATLTRYRSMAPVERGSVAQILPPDSKLLGLT